jgi:hypothetical protein
MKSLRSLLLLAGIAIVAFTPVTASAQPVLTNAATWQAGCGTGAQTGAYNWPCSNDVWNSSTTDATWNIYLSNSGPAGTLHSLNGSPFTLNVGLNTLYFYQDKNESMVDMGIDLGFDGSSLAQISGWNSINTSGVSGLSGVDTNNGSGDQNAAGLSFTDGSYQVTLTDFEWGNHGANEVGMTTLGADRDPDWDGQVTIDVETTTPEPASLVLLATGLAGLAAIKRRRAA